MVLLASPFLLIGEANALPSPMRSDKQEGCENLCMDCVEAGEGEGSFCMALYHMCCKGTGGIEYSECGCRMEM